MPANMKEKIVFLDGEITGLKSRMVSQANGVQVSKLAMLEDIRDDYQQSIERAAARQEAAQ